MFFFSPSIFISELDQLDKYLSETFVTPQHPFRALPVENSYEYESSIAFIISGNGFPTHQYKMDLTNKRHKKLVYAYDKGTKRNRQMVTTAK